MLLSPGILHINTKLSYIHKIVYSIFLTKTTRDQSSSIDVYRIALQDSVVIVQLGLIGSLQDSS